MVFMDFRHQCFFQDCVRRTNAQNDPYRKALFYTLGMNEETRSHINRLYDFKERGIDFTGLFEGWQTSGSLRVTRLAFNLYNGFAGDVGDGRKDDPELYSPYNLFDTPLLPFFFEAVKLRYPEYYHTLESQKNIDEDENECDR